MGRRQESTESKKTRHLIRDGSAGFRRRTLPCASGPHRRNGRTALARDWSGAYRARRPVMLLVVHVYREETDGEEITRIISARKAEKNDIRRYQEQEMD